MEASSSVVSQFEYLTSVGLQSNALMYEDGTKGNANLNRLDTSVALRPAAFGHIRKKYLMECAISAQCPPPPSLYDEERNKTRH